MMEHSVEKVFAYIDAHQDEYVALVQELCRQPSVANSAEGIDDMVKLVVSKLESIGADPAICETSGNPVITGFVPGKSKRTLGFYNHYDVQPVDPVNLWTYPPYSAQIHHGAIYGRGTVDNKGGLAARICAVDAWLKTYGGLPVNAKFFVEGEEEIGSPNLLAFAKSHPDEIVCDGYMWEGGSKYPDSPPEIALGAKGLLYVELHSVLGERDAHSANAAILQSAVWRLVWALSTLKNPDATINIQGFYDDIPQLTQDEVDILSTDIMDFDKARKNLGEGRLFEGSREELLTRLYYKPTCNICGITAGYQGEGTKTVLPCRASAKLDFRLVQGQDPQKILALLREHLDSNGYEDIEVRCISYSPCYRTDPDTPFAKAAVRALERMYGQTPCVRYSESGTSPMYAFCREKRIPAAMFGATNKDANIHAPDEHLGIRNFFENIKITVQVMAELAIEPD